MIDNTITITARIYRQLLGDKRFLLLALFVPLFVIYLFKVFIEKLPVGLITDPELLDILITAFIIHFTSYVLCLIVIVRERREETLARMYVHNFKRGEIVLGYLCGYAGLATLQAVLILLEVDYFFRLSFDTPIMISIFIIIWTLAMISISLGIMVSNLAKTEAQIFPFIPLFMLPSIFLSGLILPVAELPWTVRWLAYFIPLTYAVDALKIIVEQRLQLLTRPQEFCILIAYGLILLTVAGVTLKQRE